MQNLPIFIVGHSHTGTSILRSVIGHCIDVFDIDEETNARELLKLAREVPESKARKFALAKRPSWSYFSHFYKTEFEKSNLQVIFVIRNPYFVFTSLRSRFKSYLQFEACGLRGFSLFEDYSREFYRRKFIDPHERIHCIRYEDFFDNEHREITDILDKIGVPWTHEIFDNSKYKNKLNGEITNHSNLHHCKRSNQINKPFVYADKDPSKIDLDPKEIDLIKNSFCVKMIYPEFNLQ